MSAVVELDGERTAELEAAALTAMENAYAPYSSFSVGAALLDADGRIHLGCNIENASLGLSICAERVALFSAVAGGAREFSAVAIATGADELTPPCGACRQVLYEFAPDLTILLINRNGKRARYQLKELMPLAFTDYRHEDG